MAWIKVESSVARNRKFVKAGPAASWLWLCGLAYCQEGLTDGFIPREALDYLGVKNATRLATLLVLARLWDCLDDGWQIHDYFDHNKPAAEVRRIQQGRRDAGSAGGTAQAKNREALKQTLEDSLNPSTATTTATETATARTAPNARASIVAKRRLDAAWEGAKGLYVPQRKHTDFIGLRNHPDAERELLAWYEAVAEAWVGSPGGDMLRFWTARFDEKWPSQVTGKSSWGGWKPAEAS